MHRRALLPTIAAASLVGMLAVAAPANAAAPDVVTPDDFAKALSDTRATGHIQVLPAGIRIYTDGSGNTGPRTDGQAGTWNTDKVAEYVLNSTPLAQVGEPKLNLTNTSGGGVPGFQLVTDFDGDGSADGILVGEPVYNGNWWVPDNAVTKPFVKDGAPSNAGGSGSPYNGTLDQWRAKFPNANVVAFGFSLGSGVKGDLVLDSFTYAGRTVPIVATRPVTELPTLPFPEQPAAAAPTAAKPQLAATGAEPLPGILIASALAGLGATLLVMRRRARRV